MRLIVIGTARQRRDLRDALEHAEFHIIGEFDSLTDARRAGVTADAIVTPQPQGDVDDGSSPEHLTPRELQVLELVAEGLPNKTIAERIGISDQTVKFHIASISAKLGAATRTDAVRRAARRGLIAL